MVRAGLLAGRASRRAGLGAGGIVGGRVMLAMDRSVLARLSVGRRVVLVAGTNGKTTTSHFLAAALRTAGPVAHNASGANMADGAVAALAAEPDAVAVIEVDELHLAAVAAQVDPAVVVLLNLSRDQLDRGTEVRAVAAAVADALAAHSEPLVVANADDPMVVCGRPGRLKGLLGGYGQSDGRDISWLWDVPFEQLAPRPLVAAGERAADLGVRLSYAGIAHATVPDPLTGLTLLPPGRVDVVANYSAFHQLRRRLADEGRRDAT